MPAGSHDSVYGLCEFHAGSVQVPAGSDRFTKRTTVSQFTRKCTTFHSFRIHVQSVCWLTKRTVPLDAVAEPSFALSHHSLAIATLPTVTS